MIGARILLRHEDTDAPNFLASTAGFRGLVFQLISGLRVSSRF